jgi:uncharacterized protein
MSRLVCDMTRLMIALIRGYQILLSPFFGQQCRFTPTCSQYAIESIKMHGALKGFLLTLKRLSCCHPWHAGGYDPVPNKDHH